MKNNLRQNIFFFLCLLLILGVMLMDLARILPSMAMIGIVLLGISYFIRKNPYPIQKNKLPYLALSCTFIILLPSYFYSDNQTYLFEKWQVAIPYLVLPLAFMVIPQMPKRRYYQLYQFYFGLVLLTALSAFIYYLFNQQLVNQLYLSSKVMPTFWISHHPTLSIMAAFAMFIAYWLYQSGYYYRFIFERYIFLAGGVFLFIFIHVFSVRSGLLALYVLIFYELARMAIQQKRIKAAILTALSMFIVGSTTLLISPTFSNRVANTSQDLQSYRNNESANHKSLASRMISYKNAIRINKESSFLFGCGLGDISDLNLIIFKAEYPDITKPIIPHNQFLFYFAAIGFTGALVFTFLFFFPVLADKNFRNVILVVHYLVLLVAFQFEAPMETQLGVAYSLVFILIPLHQDIKI
ncbi:MAG: O-antigen ligase family protein [Bacteroidia bacterium]|nr:O-antigen ligase family protein [Bacteroidia bacterium]